MNNLTIILVILFLIVFLFLIINETLIKPYNNKIFLLFDRKHINPNLHFKLKDVSILDEGTSVIPSPFNNNNLIATQKNGELYEIDTFLGTRRVVFDARVQIDGFSSNSMEEGLLCVESSPLNNTLFLSYNSEAKGNNKFKTFLIIQEFIVNVDDNGNILNLIPNTNLFYFSLGFQENYHHGGTIQFGNDEHLYTATGEGGPQGDPNNEAQNDKSLRGKVIRFERNGTPTIIAKGLRNPWRFSIQSDNMIIGDVGWDTVESIYLLKDISTILPKNKNIANFGWSYFEGSYSIKDGPSFETFDPPIFEYPHEEGKPMAVVGGYLNSNGYYIFGDYNGTVNALKYVSNEGWFLTSTQNIGEPVYSTGINYNDRTMYVITKTKIKTIELISL